MSEKQVFRTDIQVQIWQTTEPNGITVYRVDVTSYDDNYDENPAIGIDIKKTVAYSSLETAIQAIHHMIRLVPEIDFPDELDSQG